jgi:phospholipid-translocating ATPase
MFQTRRRSRDKLPFPEEIPLQELHDEDDAETVAPAEPFRFWRRSNADSAKLPRCFHIGETLPKYDKNVVRNQKYSVVSFLPTVLYEQFRYFYNLYFLLVALSQLIKPLQIGYLFTYFGPLIFVLTVTLSKEAYDDYIRFSRDKEANSQIYEKLTENGRVWVPSSDLMVGDVVVIGKNCRVPADCVLLRTSDPSGTCFLRTDQLDGETDWKLRVAAPGSQNLASEEILESSGFVYVEEPSKDFYSFFGKITWRGGVVDGLNVENALWMNTVNASDAILGLIIYTGRDTKAVMNTNFSKTKIGLVDLEINLLAKILALVTLILSIVMVILDGSKSLWYVYFMRFLILFSSIIPISLRVNLDMGKTVYAYLMMNDENIKDTIVRTSTIPEDLGRIDFLLTDKTGTLTRNGIEC